ncbi:hypothetical protein F4703DRAFT_1792963 [Phycomyces blakesleeanus]
MYWKWSTEGYFLTPFNIFFIFLYSLYSVYKLYYKSYLNCEIGYLSPLGHYSDPSIISWYLVPLLALKLSRDQWTLSVRISKTSTPKKIKAHSGRKCNYTKITTLTYSFAGANYPSVFMIQHLTYSLFIIEGQSRSIVTEKH